MAFGTAAPVKLCATAPAAWRYSPQSFAPRLGEQLGGRAPAGLILEIDVGGNMDERLDESSRKLSATVACRIHCGKAIVGEEINPIYKGLGLFPYHRIHSAAFFSKP
jgi:hypothetical protein